MVVFRTMSLYYPRFLRNKISLDSRSMQPSKNVSCAPSASVICPFFLYFMAAINEKVRGGTRCIAIALNVFKIKMFRFFFSGKFRSVCCGIMCSICWKEARRGNTEQLYKNIFKSFSEEDPWDKVRRRNSVNEEIVRDKVGECIEEQKLIVT